MNTLFKLSCWAILPALLLGCGGSSSSGTTPGTTETPPPPVAKPHLSLSTVKRTPCDTEHPYAGVDIIVHNADGKIIATYQTNEAGKLDIEWPQEAKHVSIAGDIFRGRGAELSLRTFLNVPATKLGPISFSDVEDQTLCKCTQQKVDTAELRAQYRDYLLDVDLVLFPIESSAGLFDFYACPGVDSYPIQLVGLSGLDARAGVLTPPFNGMVLLTEADFTHKSKVLDVVVENEANLVSPPYLSTFSMDTRGARWPNKGPSGYEKSVLGRIVYPGLSENVHVRGSHEGGLGFRYNGYNLNGKFYAMQLVAISDFNQTVTMALPELTQSFTQQLQSLSNYLSSDQSSWAYDFSDYSQTMNQVFIDLTNTRRDSDWSWTVVGPLTGNVPDLEVGEALESRMQDPFSYMVFGLNKLGSGDYQDSLTERTPTTPVTSSITFGFEAIN